MRRSISIPALVVSLAVALVAQRASAHGDVTPHPIDTTGLKPLGTQWAAANPYRGDAKAIAIGAEGYKHNCAGCHGLNAESGGVAPDLLSVARDCADTANPTQREACFKDTDSYFKDITLHGKKTSDGRYTMPGYGEVFTQEAVWAVKAYLDARTLETKR